MAKPRYRRILLKLSGEAMMGERDFGISPAMTKAIASEIAQAVKMGVQVAVVVGGGNIFRGIEGSVRGMDRATADYMGMLATVMNSLALQNALEQNQIEGRVMSAIEMTVVAEPYTRNQAVAHLNKGRVVIFAAGTGSPFFTTDTAASLRALEVGADLLLKGTKVDGVYSSDPVKDSAAKFFSKLTYIEVLNKGLRVMDSTAISLCMEHGMPILVYNMKKKGNLKKVLQGKKIGTSVRSA